MNILNIAKKMLKLMRRQDIYLGDNYIQKFHLGRYIIRLTVTNSALK